MIVDTSAIVALLLGEPGADRIEHALMTERCRMSAATRVELGIVVEARSSAAGTQLLEELLERIRDIRTSEKNFYYKVREIYKLSADYEENSDATQKFFKEIQNKFHFAVHGHTAAEIINDRADAEKPNMGLTTWKNQ